MIERHTIADTAQHFKKTEQEIRELLAKSRKKLFAIRSKRPRPHLDDKVIAAWCICYYDLWTCGQFWPAIQFRAEVLR